MIVHIKIHNFFGTFYNIDNLLNKVHASAEYSYVKCAWSYSKHKDIFCTKKMDAMALP